ncbi:MAG TPA: hypothetical protein VGB77_06540, partial [Abditibacteriaceae bacterium]
HKPMEQDENQITFLASFPPIASAILRSGAGDGMQIKLSVPESEMGQAIRCQLWPGKHLEITMRVLSDEEVRDLHKRHFQQAENGQAEDGNENGEEENSSENSADDTTKPAGSLTGSPAKRGTLKRSTPRRRVQRSGDSV